MKLSKKIYELCKQIPKGRISTYKILTEKLNSKAYRAVGQILKRNPYLDVPCHRVIKNNGEVGGFRGSQIQDKIKLLKKEGVKIKNNKILDFERVLYKFK